jgi:hypothetical protein
MNNRRHTGRTEKDKMSIIAWANTLPRKMGRADFIRHLKGKRLTRDQAIRAKCFECVGGEDTQSCTSPCCSLTPYCQWNDIDE